MAESEIQKTKNAVLDLVTRILDERFGQLEKHLDQEIRTRVEQARPRAEHALSSKLNQAIRRIRLFEGEEQWARAVVDATEGFCERAAMFTINADKLHLAATRNLSPGLTPDLPLASAPAFASVVDTREPVVALLSRNELSEAIASIMGEDSGARFRLYPIAGRKRIAAILYGDGASDAVDANALEMIAAVASAVLDAQAQPPDLLKIAALQSQQPQPPQAQGVASPSLASWFSLSNEERELHLRAQRSSRVRVAQMRLYQSDAVKEGRAKRDLYTSLKQDIDAAREEFRRDFYSSSPSMVDYLHLELLRTLANDNLELLGPTYPGPML